MPRVTRMTRMARMARWLTVCQDPSFSSSLLRNQKEAVLAEWWLTGWPSKLTDTNGVLLRIYSLLLETKCHDKKTMMHAFTT